MQLMVVFKDKYKTNILALQWLGVMRIDLFYQ